MVAIVCLKLKIFYMRCRGKYLILRPTLRGACFFGGAILALLELYNINEQDFIEVWQGTREIAPPKPEHRARKASR